MCCRKPQAASRKPHAPCPMPHASGGHFLPARRVEAGHDAAELRIDLIEGGHRRMASVHRRGEQVRPHGFLRSSGATLAFL